MRCLRSLSFVFALLLLPGLALAADGPAQAQAGCKPAFKVASLNLTSPNQSFAAPAFFASEKGGQEETLSPYCDQFYCPFLHPWVACRCACDVQECECAEACGSGPGTFGCNQACRDQLNECYLGCPS